MSIQYLRENSSPYHKLTRTPKGSKDFQRFKNPSNISKVLEANLAPTKTQYHVSAMDQNVKNTPNNSQGNGKFFPFRDNSLASSIFALQDGKPDRERPTRITLNHKISKTSNYKNYKSLYKGVGQGRSHSLIKSNFSFSLLEQVVSYGGDATSIESVGPSPMKPKKLSNVSMSPKKKTLSTLLLGEGNFRELRKQFNRNHKFALKTKGRNPKSSL